MNSFNLINNLSSEAKKKNQYSLHTVSQGTDWYLMSVQEIEK